MHTSLYLKFGHVNAARFQFSQEDKRERLIFICTYRVSFKHEKMVVIHMYMIKGYKR